MEENINFVKFWNSNDKKKISMPSIKKNKILEKEKRDLASGSDGQT